jgi:hypothetical protein
LSPVAPSPDLDVFCQDNAVKGRPDGAFSFLDEQFFQFQLRGFFFRLGILPGMEGVIVVFFTGALSGKQYFQPAEIFLRQFHAEPDLFDPGPAQGDFRVQQFGVQADQGVPWLTGSPSLTKTCSTSPATSEETRLVLS